MEKEQKNNSKLVVSGAADVADVVAPGPSHSSPSLSLPSASISGLPRPEIRTSLTESKIEQQNVASIIVKNEISLDGDVQTSLGGKPSSNPSNEDKREEAAKTNPNRSYLVFKIWIRQNVFIYEFFRRLHSEVNATIDPQSINNLSLAELIEGIKNFKANIRNNLFEGVQRELSELIQLPSFVDGEMRWNKIVTLTKAVAESFDSKKTLSRGFQVDWVREKPIGWVDLFYLKICFRDNLFAQGLLYDIEKSAPSFSQPKREVRHIPTKLPSPYVSRPLLEQMVKEQFKSGRLVYLFGVCGSGKSTLACQNVEMEEEYFPINFPDALPDEKPEIVIERFAEEILEKCGVLFPLIDSIRDIMRPTSRLINFLAKQGKKSFILDPIDDVLRTEQTTERFINHLNDLLTTKVSLVLISSLNESNNLKMCSNNIRIPIFSNEESISFLTKYFATKDCSEFFEDFDYATIAHYSGNNPKALNIVANALKEKIDICNSMTKEDFLYTLNAAEHCFLTEDL